jgi:hypothetical protein
MTLPDRPERVTGSGLPNTSTATSRAVIESRADSGLPLHRGNVALERVDRARRPHLRSEFEAVPPTSSMLAEEG